MLVCRRRARPLAQARPAGPEPRIRTSMGEVEDVGGGGDIFVRKGFDFFSQCSYCFLFL